MKVLLVLGTRHAWLAELSDKGMCLFLAFVKSYDKQLTCMYWCMKNCGLLHDYEH